MTPLAARLLRAARRETGRRAAAGGPPGALDGDRLAALVEADPAARADLDAAVADARRDPGLDPTEVVSGARAERRARLDRALAAIDELLLAGELSPDGPGRVVLPGFGPGTWRALGELRAGAGAGGAAGRWAAAVAAEPLADLGDLAPEGLVEEPADPRLAPLARALHAHEADRQDARDALIRAEAAARHAADRGLRDSLATIRDDITLFEAGLARADEAIADLWRRGRDAAAVTRG